MNKNREHFDKIYKYIAWTSIFVCTYILAITFVPIPKGNMRFVDIVLAFLMGTLLGGGVNYLTGGTPDKKEDGK